MKHAWLTASVIGTLGVGTWAGVRYVYPAIVNQQHDVPVLRVDPGPFERTVSAEGILRPVKSTPVVVPSTREDLMVAVIAEDGASVKKGDLIVRFDAQDIVRKVADTDADRASADRRINKEKTLTESSLLERDRNATLTREELNNRQELGKKDPRYFPRAEVIESEIDEALYKTRLDHAQSARKIEEDLARSKIGVLAVERRKADLLNQQARTALAKLDIRAPHDGTFILARRDGRTPARTGDRVWGGMRIAEISDDSRMDAEVYVLEADAGGLAADRVAQVVLDARPDVVFHGKVKRVEPFPKQLHPDFPSQYFVAWLTLDEDTAKLKPGQRLRASITLDRQDRALVVPRQAVFRKDDQTFVYRKQGSRFETAQVAVGSGTVGRVIIREGLTAGDVIALRDPTVSAEEAARAKPAAPRERSGGGSRQRGDRNR